MAFSLSSERPIVAATSTGFVATVRGWLEKAAVARSQRTALATLLELENFRLDDLGINRADVMEALRDPTRSAGRRLSFKRAIRAAL